MLNKLLNSGYINFENLVIDNYYKIGLTEEEALILIKLYQFRKTSSYLSIPNLSKTVTMSKEDLEMVVNNLVNKGFVTFEAIEVNGFFEESFSVNNSIEKIVNATKYVERSEIIDTIESNFKRMLSAKELDIVSKINCSEQELTRAIIICLQQQVFDVNYLKKVIENNQNNGK